MHFLIPYRYLPNHTDPVFDGEHKGDGVNLLTC